MKKILLILFLSLPQILLANVAITTSGGVSLGAYEAGYLYYLSEMHKLNKMKDVSHFTGTSAGGINSYIMIDSLCSEPEDRAEESIFWKMWVSVGIEKLFVPSKVTKINVFTRDAFAEPFSKLKDNFLSGFKKDCKYVLGVAVTNEKEYRYKISESFAVNGLSDHILIQIEGKGRGVPPKITNFILNKKVQRQVLLPFGEGPENDFELIKKTLFATSAFPVASSPVSLPICVRDIFNPITSCEKLNATNTNFIDGGILDNSPLGIGQAISYELSKDGKENEYNYIYINSSNFRSLEEEVQLDPEPSEKGLLGLVFDYLIDFIDVSRNREISKIIENEPKIASRLHVRSGDFPPVSSPMYAFFGFFDKDFRVFDFSLGMSDAKALVFNLAKKKKLKLPKRKGWVLFHCIEAVKNQNRLSKEICEKKIDTLTKNIKALYDVTLHRIYNYCQKQNHKKSFCEHQEFVPDYIKKRGKGNDWRKNKSETEEAYILRLLDLHNYQYGQLTKLYPNEKNGSDLVYASQKEIFESLRSKQSPTEKILIGVVETELLKRLQYRPVDINSTYFNFGTNLEFGFSTSLSRLSKSLTLQSSIHFLDLDSYLGSSLNNLAVTPAVGFSYAPLFFPSLAYRFSFGFQLGYQFSKRDRFGGQECLRENFEYSSSNCSGGVAILSSSIVLLDRMNLKFGFINDIKKKYDEYGRSGFLMIGYQFY